MTFEKNQFYYFIITVHIKNKPGPPQVVRGRWQGRLSREMARRPGLGEASLTPPGPEEAKALVKATP